MGGFFGGGGGAAGVGGATGSTDNAILRADGTGGATLQGSALVVEDAVIAYACTGVASTDIFTAVGNNFTTNQAVRFLSLTGGGNFNNTTNYFVIDISGNTFKLSTSSGGAARDLTTDLTAGSIVAIQPNVAITNQAVDTNSSIVITPKGNGGLILGPRPDATSTGGNVRGNSVIDLQLGRSNATHAATGNNSVAIGQGCTPSGASSVAIGKNVTASGTNAICLGTDSTASGSQSIVLGSGSNTASATFALSTGAESVSDRRAAHAHSSGKFSSAGDAQTIRCVLRCKTTTNAAVEMALDGNTTYLTIPSGKVMFCNIKVVGVLSTGATVATYERQYAAKNVGGTSSEVFAPVTIGTDLASGTSLEVATVDAGDYIRIRPTGVASETWRWVASVDAVEVAYGT